MPHTTMSFSDEDGKLLSLISTRDHLQLIGGVGRNVILSGLGNPVDENDAVNNSTLNDHFNLLMTSIMQVRAEMVQLDVDSNALHEQSIANLSSRLDAGISDLSTNISDLSTKLGADISELSSKLGADISAVFIASKNGISDLSSKLGADISDLSTKLGADISDLSTKLGADISDLSSSLGADISESTRVQNSSNVNLENRMSASIYQLRLDSEAGTQDLKDYVKSNSFINFIVKNI
jgi:hypothetical protein